MDDRPRAAKGVPWDNELEDLLNRLVDLEMTAASYHRQASETRRRIHERFGQHQGRKKHSEYKDEEQQ